MFSDRVDFSFFNQAICIWEVSTEFNPTLLQLCENALTEKEREKVSFFKFKKVKNNFIISQGTLRLLLSNYLKISPKEVKIGRHSKGKPFSMDNPKLRFNMSNSGKKIVYCFSYEEELGIDLEKVRFLADLDDLIDKNFTPFEKKYITSTEKEKENRFFKFWTIKEAYLKAIGVGMRIPPGYLSFSVQNGAFKLESIKGEMNTDNWFFKNLDCGDNYKATLVYKNEKTTILQMKIV